MDLVRTSKRLSYVLRHRPDSVGLTLGAGGWVGVDELLHALARHGTRITRDDLEYVVAHNDKRRFIIDGDRIRANQGHSMEVDLGLTPVTPPDRLYHGTARHNLDPIFLDGLVRGNRHHVHLSADEETALKVGARHGSPVVLAVDAAAMTAEGLLFYRSENGVWLTDHVPARHLTVVRTAARVS
ncbi:RNA 2'-phosphotransferase [Hamadaea sp. NPDC051192]|uniref:RNA 2'-phosphotransferase n=1 Tax=Hamadaea sp. NPDC051192 TaxID=3154940 RepID=UPI00343C2EE0